MFAYVPFFFFLSSFGPEMLLSKMLAETEGDKPEQLYLLKPDTLHSLHCVSLTCFCIEAGNKQD